MKPRGRRVGMVALSILASLTVLILDASGHRHSPIEPLRTAMGTIVGPAQKASDDVWRPLRNLGGFMSDNRSLRQQVDRLKADNDHLKSALALQPLQLRELSDLQKLTALSSSTGYSLVSARVVAMGSAQTFERTVTIDAGTRSGIHADLTVVSAAGLVGRVIRATPTSATVLLVTDPNSVVGGRLASALTIGNVKGTETAAPRGSLRIELAGAPTAPVPDEPVVTWGSPNGIPYVAGIPIGTVANVTSNPRDLTASAVIRPYVDFAALDLVGVVVPSGTTGDRPLINPAAQ